MNQQKNGSIREPTVGEPANQNMTQGKLQIYTGNGKGKTTAALGLLLRYLGTGNRACLIQFDKGSGDGPDFYSERVLLRTLPNLALHSTGCVRFDEERKTFRFKNGPWDVAEAQKGLGLARQAIRSSYGLVVLDEILSLVMTQLVNKEDVISLVDDFYAYGKPCELIMTGHVIWPKLAERADLITEMKKMKHYFDKGTEARKGIEF